MRTRALTTITLAAAGLLALTACSTTPSSSKPAGGAPIMTTAAAGPSSSGAGLSQLFGQTYAWPDGVKVTITGAKLFTAYDASIGESATAGSTDYQVMIKVTNEGSAPLDLTTLSVITAGATSGGEASATAWNNAAPPLEGTLAPGGTVTKGDPETLETTYGKKIVVTVQRMSDPVMPFPEFTGSITG